MILVDTSIWIEFFKGNPEVEILNSLIDDNSLCINDLILSELLHSINQRKEYDLKELLCRLKNGLNKLGMPDLVVAQNAIPNNLQIYSRDYHFDLMSSCTRNKTFCLVNSVNNCFNLTRLHFT